MLLTLLVNKTKPEVGIVRWVRYPKTSGYMPHGTRILMSAEEFRLNGLKLIRDYREEYERSKIELTQVIPPFAPAEERNCLKQCTPIIVFRDQARQLVLAPLRFQKYNLGDMGSFGPESFRKLPWHCSAESFWSCFDAVLAEAG